MANASAGSVPHRPQARSLPALDAVDGAAPHAVEADGSGGAHRWRTDPELRRALHAVRTPTPVGKARSGQAVRASTADIPAVALAAYERAALSANAAEPGCHVPWSVIAGIGRVESDHGRHAGSRADTSGVVHPAILGPILDGSAGNAPIPDTDAGRYDGNAKWDRAVGPMQFIPSSWMTWQHDGNADGVRDPENVFDAALAAAHYLCASGGDLRTRPAAERAVMSYNHSRDYVLVVLAYAQSYATTDPVPVRATVGAARPPAPRPWVTWGYPGFAPTPTRPVSSSPPPAQTPVPEPVPVPTRTPRPEPVHPPSRTPEPDTNANTHADPNANANANANRHPTPTPTPTPSAGCTVSSILVPSCGVWWGIGANPLASESYDQALTNFERLKAVPPTCCTSTTWVRALPERFGHRDVRGAGQEPDPDGELEA